jgi:hypothetical protein
VATSWNGVARPAAEVGFAGRIRVQFGFGVAAGAAAALDVAQAAALVVVPAAAVVLVVPAAAEVVPAPAAALVVAPPAAAELDVVAPPPAAAEALGERL